MAAKGIQTLMPLVTLPMILKSLPISEYGTFSALLAASTLIGVVTQYGFLYFLPRKVSEIQNKEELSQLLVNVLLFQVALAFPLSLIYLAYIFVSGISTNYTLAMEIYFFVILQIITPMWFFQGCQRNFTIILLQLMSSFFIFTALFIFQNSLTLNQLTFSYLLVYCAVFLTSIVFTHSFGIHSFRYLNFNFIKGLVNDAKSEFFQQIFPNLYNNGLVVLLSTQLDSQTFGVFSVALKVTNAFLGMVISICLASYPIIVRARNALNPLNSLVILSGLTLSVILFGLADYIAVFLLSENSVEVSFFLRLLSPSPLLISISRSLGFNYLNLIGKQMIAQNYTIWISVVFGILGAVLILYAPIIGFVSSIILARFSLAACGGYFYYIFQKDKLYG